VAELDSVASVCWPYFPMGFANPHAQPPRSVRPARGTGDWLLHSVLDPSFPEPAAQSVHRASFKAQANPSSIFQTLNPIPRKSIASPRVVGRTNSNGYGPERAGFVLDWPNAASISPGEPLGKRFSNAVG
jgi:hypothetical protein